MQYNIRAAVVLRAADEGVCVLITDTHVGQSCLPISNKKREGNR